MCVPHLYCSVHYADLVTAPSSTPCWLAINTPGICCYPTVPNVGKVINVIIADWRKILLFPQIGLLQRAEIPPSSESPVEFDAYSLNHAAFVGLNEVAWTVEFEKELSRRRVFVNKVGV